MEENVQLILSPRSRMTLLIFINRDIMILISDEYLNESRTKEIYISNCHLMNYR